LYTLHRFQIDKIKCKRINNINKRQTNQLYSQFIRKCYYWMQVESTVVENEIELVHHFEYLRLYIFGYLALNHKDLSFYNSIV